MAQVAFDQEEFSRLRQAASVTWGRPVRFLTETASTNDLALAAIPTDARTGIVWLALSQTSGRGRRGSRWYGAPGESLLMSVLLRWPPGLTVDGVPLATGLAIRDLCAELVSDVPFQLKWPNDVSARGEKVSGVLVEKRRVGHADGLVIGIGLNLLTETFAKSWGRPTSLLLLGAKPESLRLESVLAHLLAHLERRIGSLMKHGLTETCRDANHYDALTGRGIRIIQEDLAFEGIARGVTSAGRLRVETVSGWLELESGHIELLTHEEEASLRHAASRSVTATESTR